MIKIKRLEARGDGYGPLWPLVGRTAREGVWKRDVRRKINSGKCDGRVVVVVAGTMLPVVPRECARQRWERKEGETASGVVPRLQHDEGHTSDKTTVQ